MRKPIPLPTTVGDCFLLQQMGYSTPCGDGKPVAVAKGRSVDRCVCCGAYVPEGMQVCWSCRKVVEYR